MNSKGYEFSFSWIFTILVGAMIIALAVYASTRLVDVKRTEQQTEVGKQLGILISPVETNLEQAKFTTITFNPATKLYNSCLFDGNFGSQQISAKVKSGIGGAWTPEPGFESSFHNKYLFSSVEVSGTKKMYVLSKPFLFPFKIADLIVVWGDEEKYCFVFSNSAGSQGEIKKEFDDLGITKSPNAIIRSVNDKTKCASKEKTVCFQPNGCDIDVNTNLKTIAHNELSPSQTVYYIDSFDSNDKYALLYAAIFSDPQVYNCHINRLMQRASHIAELYAKKSEYLSSQGQCLSVTLPIDLRTFAAKATSTTSSEQLSSLYTDAESLNDKNKQLTCRLY